MRAISDFPKAGTVRMILRTAFIASCAALTLACPAYAQEMLDLARLGKFPLEASDAVPQRPRPPGRIEPAYARDMQRNVIAAMSRLTRAYIEATEDPAFVPESSREIAQSPSSAAGSPLASSGDRRKSNVQNERFDFVRNQIIEGMHIWKIAGQFHANLFSQNDLSDEQIYIYERQRIAAQLTSLNTLSGQLKTGPELRVAAAEVAVWTNILQSVEKRRSADKVQFARKLDETKLESSALSKELQTALMMASSRVQFARQADFLAAMAEEAVNLAPMPAMGSASGYGFLMGLTVKPAEGDIDSSVIDFMTKAKTTAVTLSPTSFGPAEAEIRSAQALSARLLAAADRVVGTEPRPE